MMHGLDGVDDNNRGGDLVDVIEDVGEGGLRGQPERGLQCAEAFGPQTHLLLGLLS